jgi:hypothetical protein
MKKLILFLIFSSSYLGTLFFAPSIAFAGSPGSEVPYTVAEKGSQAGFRSGGPQVKAFTSGVEFEQFYTKLHTRLPAPEPPQIDFSDKAVVFIGWGRQPTAGYSIEVDSVRRKGTRLMVSARLKEPEGDFQAQVITHPWVLLTVESTGFEQVELNGAGGEVTECDNGPES